MSLVVIASTENAAHRISVMLLSFVIILQSCYKMITKDSSIKPEKPAHRIASHARLWLVVWFDAIIL